VRGDKTQEKQVQGYLARYGRKELLAFLERLGGLFLADERGRYYPAGRQASAITDLLRYEIAARGVEVQTGAYVQSVQKVGGRYEVKAKTEDGVRTFTAQSVVVCTGGMAAKNFGTDGNGYGLAKSFSHTTTALYPALVQLKTDVRHTKTLKGLRVMDACLTATVDGKPVQTLTGDVIFTDYGISGDAVFRISSFVADKLEGGKVSLSVDLLPTVSAEKLLAILTEKQANYPQLPQTELLCGILNNQVGRAVMKRYGEGGLAAVVAGIKAFTLPVVGSLGFDYAQITKGGIPLAELDENLQSRNAEGLYFAGEILDVDGECGGFNLQWAYTSAMVCLEAIEEKCRG
jgi:predicted Rossmann fold flavoprotein